MILNWDSFKPINENLQRARRILREINVPETDPNFIKLRALLSRNPGYLGKFTEWLYKDKIGYKQLENLFDRIKGSTLPKQIDLYKSPEEIIDSLIRTGSEAAVNQMIGAIPSRTRETLKSETSGYCDECDGDGTIECDTCDGDGEVTCDQCDGGCYIPTPNKKGVKKSHDANGDEIGSTDCPKCMANGRLPCPNKCDNGHFKCPECAKRGTPWDKLISFFALHKDKKDLIIDFLSKKSGRYGEDYDDDDACDALRTDIDKILNTPSVESVKAISQKDKDIKFIYEDDLYLIVAVNYNGIRRIGSSYWCIVEDEDTFDSYVKEETRMQLVLYVKGKSPLVDEKSVMGITIDADKSIEAAHWEDDSECHLIASNIINGVKAGYEQGPRGGRRRVTAKPALNISSENLMNALFTLYNYDDDDLQEIIFKARDLYVSRINKCLTKIAFKDLLVDFSNYCDNESIYDNELSDHGFTKYFREVLRNKEMRIPMSVNDLANCRLIDVCEFNKNWLSMDLLDDIEDYKIDDDYTIELVKFFVKNGYDINKNISGHADKLPLLMNSGLVEISKYYTNIDWDDDDEDTINDTNVKWIIENDFDFGMKNITIPIIEYLSRLDILIKYKDKINDLLVNRRLGEKACEFISQNVDDDEMSINAVRNLLPSKLTKKFKFDVSRIPGANNKAKFPTIQKKHSS